MINHRNPTGRTIPPQRGPRLGTTLTLICAVPALLAFLSVAAPALAMPAAASLEIAPPRQLRWDALSYEDRCPTPRDGYCKASFARRRHSVGPLQLRYSYSY